MRPLSQSVGLCHNVQGVSVAEELPHAVGAAQQQIVLLKIQDLHARPQRPIWQTQPSFKLDQMAERVPQEDWNCTKSLDIGILSTSLNMSRKLFSYDSEFRSAGFGQASHE